MEAQAIFEMAIEAWESENYTLGTMVAGNSTIMKTTLKHSFKFLIEARKMNRKEWTRTKGRVKKKDTRRLPIHLKSPLLKPTQIIER